MHKAQKPASMLIITGSNAAKLLELEKEAFNEMAFFVPPPVAEPRLSFIQLRWNAIIGPKSGNVFPKSECSVCLVSQYRSAIEGDMAQ